MVNWCGPHVEAGRSGAGRTVAEEGALRTERKADKRTAGSRRSERRQLQDEISRTHILDAAEAVFGRRGFHEATVREIAAEADFSAGAIYNFFDGKDDLFAKVMERKGRGMVAVLERAVEGDGSPHDKLHALADAQIDYYSVHRDFYRLILRTAGPSWWSMKAELDESSADRFVRAIDIETEVFAAGADQGQFQADDPETMAVLFLGIMQGFLTRWLLLATPDAETTYPRHRLHALLDRAFLSDEAPRRSDRG
jgi:AcrR family transcriptional regulator